MTIYKVLGILCCLIITILCLDYYLFKPKEDESVYIKNKFILKHNITKSSWCSIEIESFLLLFFMCYNRIPKIGKFFLLYL